MALLSMTVALPHVAPALSLCPRSCSSPCATASANAESLILTSSSKSGISGRKNGPEQGLVRFGPVKRLARRGDERDSPERQVDRHRPFGRIEPFREATTQFPVFLGCRSHQSHVGVVAVETALAILLRDRFGCPEVDHIQTAWRHHRGDPCPSGCPKAPGTGAHHSSGELIREFRGRDVRHRGDAAGRDETLHSPPLPRRSRERSGLQTWKTRGARGLLRRIAWYCRTWTQQ